MTVFIVEKIQ